jgi:RNA polymerase sigma factor (sigma-70 family)
MAIAARGRRSGRVTAALRPGSPARMCESLYQRHVKDVYRYTLAMLDCPADAEDATQTTFLNAYRALERGERPRDSRSWLQAIALNVCREHYRRARRRPLEVSLEEDPGELVLDPPTPGIGEVMRGLSALPFSQRAALVMREFEGRSLAEIAAALGVSASAVEALLFRARRGLREQLEATLSCGEAEQSISRQLDGALPRSERGPLRAHLRQCPDCASLARRLRAQRSAIRSFAVIPLPASLKLSQLAAGGAAAASGPAGVAAGISSGGSVLASIIGSAAAKVAVATVIGATAVGVGYVSFSHKASRPAASPRAASNAEGTFHPGGASVKLVGRGGLKAAASSARTSRSASAYRAHRGPAQRRAAPAASSGRAVDSGRAASSTVLLQAVTPVARGNGHRSGGAGLSHGQRSSTTAGSSPSSSGSSGQVPVRWHPNPHGPHPTSPPNPAPQTTTPAKPPTPTPTPNHGVGNGNGNGNGNGQHAQGKSGS